MTQIEISEAARLYNMLVLRMVAYTETPDGQPSYDEQISEIVFRGKTYQEQQAIIRESAELRKQELFKTAYKILTNLK